MTRPLPPLWQYSAQELQVAYRAQECSPVDVLQACLARINQVQPRIGAFTALRAGAAMAEAHASAKRWRGGTPLSALDGVPVSIKDNLLTRDMPTTWGCPALATYQPPGEELAVTRLRQAGALIVGKTNVPEFTLEGYTDNPLFGPSRNPWDLALTPGGSSGGAAASVAAGCTPLAIGTDGGGSTRRPAAHCGLVGLKPSIGTVARSAGLPSLLLDFEVIGLLARDVADVQLALHVLGGPDPADRESWAAQAVRQAQAGMQAATPAPESLRILYVPALDDCPVDPQVARQCAAAMSVLEQLGHRVTRGELPLDLTAINANWPYVSQIGLDHLFTQHPAWREGASAKYQAMAAEGAAQPGRRLWEIWTQVRQLRQDCAGLFAQWDCIAMPSAAALPWPAAQAWPAEIAGQAVGPRGHAAFTGWVNAAGLPGLSVPTAPADGGPHAGLSTGLPIGLQLIGPFGTEDRLLTLAAGYESLLPWRARRPPL
ncbi:amidase [Corticibacter populi]|uniref:Amidase n=1 Tax=Corticibacter populi TaxID=1550736 RepID=A0A3M6QTR6_9BURK|nr:amidase [Corticibacter populi]RMX06373.1 amidase [Corticibacter populi]RZS32081.1 aspartyl-tRNA(Asn)/glutamyl-tRNA(Gln) amidotransferase subunit A [Corticibacter populi]